MTSHSLLQQFFQGILLLLLKHQMKNTHTKKNPKKANLYFSYKYFYSVLLLFWNCTEYNVTYCSKSGFSLLGGAWMFKSLIFLYTGRKEACIIKQKGWESEPLTPFLNFYQNYQTSTQRLSKTPKQTSAWSDCNGKI